MKEESHGEEMGLLFYGSGMPTFWLRLLLFIEEESQTPNFKIQVGPCYHWSTKYRSH